MAIKLDPFKAINYNTSIKRGILSKTLEYVVPFNRGLGIKIKEISIKRVVLVSKDRWRRRNHVGSAHACFLALLGEYPAGLVIAQNFSFDQYRVIISNLQMEYKSLAHGRLTATATRPKEWPNIENGEAWLDMVVPIVDEEGKEVATATTKWQIKKWDQVKSNEPKLRT